MNRFSFAAESRLIDAVVDLKEPLTAATAPASIKKGDVLLGQFTVDDTWYRAKVEEVFADNEIAVWPHCFFLVFVVCVCVSFTRTTRSKVRYVDYGNAEVLPRNRLRSLPVNSRRTFYFFGEFSLSQQCSGFWTV